jgi:methyl-accepting chemotaxis protein
MARHVNSVRSKMLLPAAIAIVGSLLATGATIAMSRQAARNLALATGVDFPALQLYQDVRRQTESLHTELRVAAATGDADRVDMADGIRDEAVRLLRDDGPGVIGQALAGKFASDIEEYYTLARTDTLAQAVATARARKGGAKTGEAIAPEPSEAVSRLFNKLIGRIDTEAHAGREIIENRFTEVVQQQKSSVAVGFVAALAAALLSAVLAWWLSGRTVRPLRALSELTTRIAAGDLTQEVPVLGGDEVGVLADGFRQMLFRLREIVSMLKAASHELASAAERLGGATRAQSSMLALQASGVAETGVATRQLEQSSAAAAQRAASVLEVARRAAELSQAGHSSAERSAEELKKMQESIDGIVGQSERLLDQARQIGPIVESVRDLAAQSHVLSLNASLEAVRAGDAGRGFSVVAKEVRGLAEQSGNEAARIGRLVSDILGAVQTTRDTTAAGSVAMAGSLAQVRASGESLRDIGPILQETGEAIEQIATAVREQSTGIGQIAAAMRDINKGMEDTVVQIHTLEESAASVASTAQRIFAIAGEFAV